VTATTLPRPATSESKQELGQFFTPMPVAEFMASLFESSHDEIRHADFIESALEFVREDLFTSAKAPFNAALLNPPYRKINSDSHTRRLLREAGIETSNLYTGFLALAARLLCDGGEMVSITPRSFCNGPYFRPFRREFLDSMSLERLHVFDSRSAA
jgi:adenine-specific DNA-methyltransferase